MLCCIQVKEFKKELVSLIDQRIRKYLKNIPVKPISMPKGENVDHSRYLTRKQTAYRIGYSVGSIDRFRREGKLHPVFPFGGSSIRYDREEIDRVMQTLGGKRRS